MKDIHFMPLMTRKAKATRLWYQESKLNWSWKLSELFKTVLSWVTRWRICARTFPFTSWSRVSLRWMQLPRSSLRQQCPRNVSQRFCKTVMGVIACNSVLVNYRFASLGLRSSPATREIDMG